MKNDLRKYIIINSIQISLIFIVLNIIIRNVFNIFILKNETIFIGALILLVNLIPYKRIKMGYIPFLYYGIIILFAIMYFLFFVINNINYINVLSIYVYVAAISLGISLLNIEKFLSQKEYEEYKNYVNEFVDSANIRTLLCSTTISISIFLLTISLKQQNNTVELLFGFILIIVYSVSGALIMIENNHKIKGEISKMFNRVLNGDIDIQLKCYSPDECGKLAITMNEVVKYIGNYINEIKNKKDELDIMMEKLLKSFYIVMEKINITVNSINTMLLSVEKGKENFEKISEISNLMFLNFNSDYDAINYTLNKYDELTEALNSINTIAMESFKSVQSIKLLQSKLSGIIVSSRQISENIKILSINAEIEASDAGEYGKRFGVIAEEIRKLSEQSSKTSHNIEETINIISNYIKDLTGEIERSLSMLKENKSKMTKMTSAIENATKLLYDLKNKENDLMKIIQNTKNNNNEIINNSIKTKEFLENTSNELEKLKEYFVLLSASIEKLIIERGENEQ